MSPRTILDLATIASIWVNIGVGVKVLARIHSMHEPTLHVSLGAMEFDPEFSEEPDESHPKAGVH